MNLWQRVRRRWEAGDLAQATWRAASRKVLRLGRKLRTADAWYWLDAERVLTRRYAQGFSGLAAHHRQYGNYWLDGRVPLGPASVVYSLGVGGDVEFDRAVAEAHGCKVHLYDPTPGSIAFIADLKERAADRAVQLFEFHPVGAWNQDTTLTFTMPGRGGSASAVNTGGLMSTTFEAPCESIRTMMGKNRHRAIDVLKMDIEGAAEIVIDDLLAHQIFPTQLVVEFERPTSDVRRFAGWFTHLEQLCEAFRRQGYEITLLPRTRGKYFGLELLFARF